MAKIFLQGPFESQSLTKCNTKILILNSNPSAICQQTMEACFHQGIKKRYFYITIQTFSHNFEFLFHNSDFCFAILRKKKS